MVQTPRSIRHASLAACLLATLAIAVLSLPNQLSAASARRLADPGLTYQNTAAYGCLQADYQYSVNTDTYSVKIWYYLFDSADNPIGGPLGTQTINVTPGSGPQSYFATGNNNGDKVVIFTHAFGLVNGGGTAYSQQKQYAQVNDVGCP
jgi:hypothetical protein